MNQYVCEECRAGISAEASTCPHCGYDGRGNSGILSVCAVLFGGVLTMTIIGMVIGIPMVVWGMRRLKQRGEKRPGVEVQPE